MSNDERSPSVGLSIFPRINFLKSFKPRAFQRDANGRIYGPFRIYIDGEPYTPGEDGG